MTALNGPECIEKGFEVIELSTINIETVTVQFRSCFFKVIESAKVNCRKPGEKIYNLTLEKLGIDAAEAVFIDDMARNVETAKSLGWQGIEVLM